MVFGVQNYSTLRLFEAAAHAYQFPQSHLRDKVSEDNFLPRNAAKADKKFSEKEDEMGIELMGKNQHEQALSNHGQINFRRTRYDAFLI